MKTANDLDPRIVNQLKAEFTIRKAARDIVVEQVAKDLNIPYEIAEHCTAPILGPSSLTDIMNVYMKEEL